MKNYNNQKGAIAVMTAFLLPVFLVFTGIAVDVGRLYVEKAKMQNLADSAATAALIELKQAYPTMYKEGSGTLTTTIPIGAVSHVTDFEGDIRSTGSNAANVYLIKNSSLGNFPMNASTGSGSNVETNVYTLKSSELEQDNVAYRYYYEVILSKEFPVYFARFVHPDDVLVRAGAVCMIDIMEPPSTKDYSFALENWSEFSKTQLQHSVSSANRLAADKKALENIANRFLGQDRSLVTGIYPKNDKDEATKGTEQITLVDYTDNTDKTDAQLAKLYPNNPEDQVSVLVKPNTAADGEGNPLIHITANDLVHWMQGDYGTDGQYDTTKDYDPNQRYFFSDYALYHKDSIKVQCYYNDKNNKNLITKVVVQINPGDAGNKGSGPLKVQVGK